MRPWLLLLPLLAGCLPPGPVARNVIMPEVRDLQVRDPAQVPPPISAPLPPPRTVSEPTAKAGPWELSLDECMRIALVNAKVVRVLTGLSVQSSGQTVYDVPITLANIDQAQARFDPRVEHRQSFNHTETPGAAFNPFDPRGVSILTTPTDQYSSEARLAKTNVLGGEWLMRWTETPTRFKVDPLTSSLFALSQPGASLFPLNPQTPWSVELSYTQPLLQGGGFAYNTAPIVIARLDTERSFFQYKDSVQELVRGVAEGYWQLMQARTEAWARQIQVDASKEAFEREVARLKLGLGNRGNEAQARLTYNQFVASLVAAKAAVLAREGALRNLLGLSPEDGRQIVPVSVPAKREYRPDWAALLRLAEERRPDIVELKLILEADQVRMVQAENSMLPKLDAVALYRWNGLTGTIPATGEHISTRGGDFTDWTVGVNFSVPLGLREGRAKVRQQSLMIARDRANLDQGLHAASHSLAIVVRDLDSAYQQYRALRDTQEAALENLKVQFENYRAGREVLYLNVLQALQAWGDAVNSEAAALLSYNVQLANLEQTTGTILETHGMVFNEERFRAAGPLLLFKKDYPGPMSVEGGVPRYPAEAPQDNALGLKKPDLSRAAPEEKPVLRIRKGGD
jgi:outer membrane protein TolC